MGISYRPKLGCLVMAAGNAARFGENKLAAVFEGKTLIRRALESVPGEVFSEVVVVTQYPEIEQLAEEFGFSSIHNAHPDRGISHTIRLGTEKMHDCDAVLYMVSDQPLLERDSVSKIVKTWTENPSFIVGASHNGKRGNPCIFPQKFFPELMELHGDHGGNTVIRRHPECLKLAEISQPELTDVDTPKALEDIKKQTK